MQQLKKSVDAKVEVQSGKSVSILLQSRIVQLSGNWFWDLYADAVFCSDVILSTPFEFNGTKGILHPDDKENLATLLAKGNKWAELQFRIITTYGEVKTLLGQQIAIEEDETETDRLLHTLLFHSKEENNLSQLKQLATAFSYIEKPILTGLWYHNTATLQTYYSSQVFRLHDLPPASLNAHLNTFEPFIHPDDRDTVTTYLDKAYKMQVPLHIDYRIVTPYTEKWVRHITQWIFSPQGELVWLGLLQDVTQQVEMEQQAAEVAAELQFTKQLLQLDEQHAGLGHWYTNLLTRKTYYSDQVYRMFGLKAQSIPANINTFVNYIYPDDKEAYETALRQMLKSHHLPEMEYRIVRSDGRVRNISHQMKLVQLNGEVLIAGSIRDVTVEKALEKKIAGQVEALLIQQLTTQQATEMAGIGSWTWDLQTGQVEWSESFYKLLGLRPQPTPLTQKHLLGFVYAEDRKNFTDAIKLMVEKKRETEFDFRLIQRGEIKNIKALFRSVNNEVTQLFIATFHDVTAIYQLQHQLNQQQQMLQVMSANMHERVIITNEDNQVLFWNAQSEAYYKIKSSEAIVQNYFELFPHAKTGEDAAMFNRVLQGESIHMAEIGPDKQKKYYNLHLVPVWNDEGSAVTGIIHMHYDVTRELQLRKNINERLSFIESLVESSIDPIIALDRHMNYLVWNKRCETLYGLTKDQVIGKNMLEVYPETRNAPAYNDFRRALHGETIYLPAKITSIDPFYYETYLLPVRNEKNEIIAILWTQHDLSKEASLNAQTLKIHNILEALNESYYELDEAMRFMAVNQLAEDFWQIKREDLIGKTFLEVFPQAQNSDVFQQLMLAQKSRKPLRGEYISPITNTWIHISFAPTLNGLAVIFYDIQRIKETQLAAQENAHLIQQINEATPDAITIFNLQQNQPEYLNKVLPQWLGYTPQQLVDMKMEGRLQLIHPEDRDRLLQFNKKMLKAKDDTIGTIEYRLQAAKGMIWIRNRGKVFKRDANGNVTHLLSVLQDISEEVHLRNQLEDRSRYAQLIFEDGIEQMILVDASFNILAWNKRSEEITGIKKEAAIGQNYFQLFPKHSEDEKIKKAFNDAASGNFVHLPPQKAIYINGIFERFLKPFKNADGDTYAILVIVHDLTNLQNQSEALLQLNKTLEIKNKELEQKNEEIMHFSFVASHDLKEPLRKLHMYTGWLQQNEIETLSDTGQGYLERMHEAVLRIEWLIEDILVLTKIHSDTHLTDEAALHIMLGKVKGDMEEELHLSGAIIESDQLPVIKGNNHQLFYLFKNLLDNAIKFQPDGNRPYIKITAAITTEKPHSKATEETYLKISFTDNGLGFDNKYAGKIFRIFQRLHNKHEYKGTGIGLAICKKIMDNHQGFIKAESKTGEGSVFTLYFPASCILTI